MLPDDATLTRNTDKRRLALALQNSATALLEVARLFLEETEVAESPELTFTDSTHPFRDVPSYLSSLRPGAEITYLNLCDAVGLKQPHDTSGMIAANKVLIASPLLESVMNSTGRHPKRLPIDGHNWPVFRRIDTAAAA